MTNILVDILDLLLVNLLLCLFGLQCKFLLFKLLMVFNLLRIVLLLQVLSVELKLFSNALKRMCLDGLIIQLVPAEAWLLRLLMKIAEAHDLLRDLFEILLLVLDKLLVVIDLCLAVSYLIVQAL